MAETFWVIDIGQTWAAAVPVEVDDGEDEASAVELADDLFGDRFRCITADPPWLERGGGKSKRGADRQREVSKAMLGGGK